MTESVEDFRNALKRVVSSSHDNKQSPQRAFTKSLEWDLCHLREELEDDQYAEKVYCALCNNEWMNVETKDVFSCSWRRAGEIVAYHRPFNECYLDYYPSESGCEGSADALVVQDLARLGWLLISDDTEDPSVKSSLEESAKILKEINSTLNG